jgi:5'-3' exoribonuclease 1
VEDFAKRYINKFAYTGYPYLKESKIVRISDGITEFTAQYKTGRVVDPDDAKTYRATLNNIRNYHKISRGIDLNEIRALVYVKTVSGLRRNNAGALVKHYSDNEEIYPLQLVVEDVLNKDERNTERPPLPINEEFPIDSKVIFLGDYAYGGQATVTGYSSTSRLELSVVKASIRKEPTVGYQIAKLEHQRTRYFPSSEVARNLRIHPLFLSKITSSFMIFDEKNKRVNVGLDLKFESRREKVIGFTRKGERGWLFSADAIGLITDYRKRFGPFFNDLSKWAVGRDIPSVNDIWPKLDSKGIEQRLREITEWLRGVKDQFNRASLESDALSRPSILKIESEIKLYSQEEDQSDSKKLIGVPKEAVLDPNVSFNKLKSQSFELGDRVIYVHNSGKVPLFSKGTVVAYNSLGSNVALRVLFDKPLIGGNTLEGRLTTNRGLDVDSSLVLNISNRQFIYHSKASSTKKIPNKVSDKYTGKAPSAKKAIPKPAHHAQAPQNSHVPQSGAAEPQQQKPAVTSKPKKNELLSLLKEGKSKPKEGESKAEENETAENEESHNDYQKANTLRSIQASILNQLNGQPELQPIPNQAPFPGPHYAGPPPPFFPVQGFPGQPIPQFGYPPNFPNPPQEFGANGSETNQPDASRDSSSRGRGNGRGRGRGRGRGGPNPRGRGRGKPTST